MNNTIDRYKASFPLQPVFLTNADGCGDHIFTQIKRSGNVCLYRRNKASDGRIMAYEVIITKTIKAGAPLPGGSVVANDYENYPGKSQFGKAAWFCVDEQSADDKFEKLIKDTTVLVSIVEVSTEEVKDESSDIPVGEFTQSQFAVHNCMPPRGVVYNVLQSLINKGVVRISQRVQIGGGRPTILYTAV